MLLDIPFFVYPALSSHLDINSSRLLPQAHAGIGGQQSIDGHQTVRSLGADDSCDLLVSLADIWSDKGHSTRAPWCQSHP